MNETVRLYDNALEVHRPNHVSSSQFQSWEKCRLQWALRVGGVTLKHKSADDYRKDAGKVIHAALTEHYRTELALRGLEKLKASAAGVLTSLSYEALDSQHDKVYGTLDRFWKKYGDDGIVPIGTDMQINLHMRDEEGMLPSYVGYIDMLLYDEAEEAIVVEEWKTSLTDIDPIQYTFRNRQVFDYAAVAAVGRGVEQIGIRYMFLTPERAKRTMVMFYDLQGWKENMMVNMASEMTRGKVRPTYGAHCGRCPYEGLCILHSTGGDVKTELRENYTVGQEEKDG